MGTWSSPHALREEGGRGSNPAVQERNRTVARATTHSTERPPNFKEQICVFAGEVLKVTKTKTLEERDITKARAACDQVAARTRRPLPSGAPACPPQCPRPQLEDSSRFHRVRGRERLLQLLQLSCLQVSEAVQAAPTQPTSLFRQTGKNDRKINNGTEQCVPSLASNS